MLCIKSADFRRESTLLGNVFEKFSFVCKFQDNHRSFFFREIIEFDGGFRVIVDEVDEVGVFEFLEKVGFYFEGFLFGSSW